MSPAVEHIAEEATLILMMGLPYAGKSTRAGALAAELGAPIVCPDAIRFALHGHRFLRDAEMMIWTLADYMVRSFFHFGYRHVILDACNGTRKRRDPWHDGPWRTEISYIMTMPSVCVDRARAVGDEVILPVIEQMSLEWETPGPDERVREVTRLDGELGVH